MAKMSFTNNQTAFEYALYMMASSYFRAAKCQSRLIEGNMALQYREQKLDSQYRMEETCIRFLDDLVKHYPAGVWQQEVTVTLNRNWACGPTEIRFTGPDYLVSFFGFYAGKDSWIQASVWSLAKAA